MFKKVTAKTIFKDGKVQIVEYKLRHNLPFAKSEMKKWIMEKDKGNLIKEIKFLNSNQIEFYKSISGATSCTSQKQLTRTVEAGGQDYWKGESNLDEVKLKAIAIDENSIGSADRAKIKAIIKDIKDGKGYQPIKVKHNLDDDTYTLTEGLETYMACWKLGHEWINAEISF